MYSVTVTGIARAHQTRSDVIERWLVEAKGSLSHQTVDDVEFFEVVACTRRIFSILTAIRHGAKSLGMRAGAEATMKKQIHHLVVAYALLRQHTNLVLPGVEKSIEMLRDENLPAS